jgi:sialate O-acetylesterase
MKTRFSLLLLPCMLVLPLAAKPRLPDIFGDHAVLQRGKPVPVWGQADPSEQITVRYGTTSAQGVADKNGKWTVTLPALTEGAPQDLVVTGNGTVTSHDVITGDVWLCSGQSNLAWSLSQSENRNVGAEEIINEAPNAQIREFHRRPIHIPFAAEPQSDLRGEWAVANPKNRREFSAVAYLYARELNHQLHIPQGVIVSADPGTFIESWMSNEALRAAGIYDEMTAKWGKTLADFPALDAKNREEVAAWEAAKKEAEATGAKFTQRRPSSLRGPGHHDAPSSCFNTLINPIVPYGLKGLVWYQGEQNIGRRQKYADLLRCFLADLRQRWSDPSLPVLIVQLPNFKSDNADRPEWAIFREAQASLQKEPHNFMATTIDLGTPDNVHPADKRELCRRLAAVALKEVYGQNVHAYGPRLKNVTRDGAGLRVSFVSEASPLVLQAAQVAGKTFELAGADGRFFPATAKVTGNDTLNVESPSVGTPTMVRYLWANAPAAILYDSKGLPAYPFNAEVGSTLP